MAESRLPEGLLEIMQCPRCGGGLTEQAEPPALRCAACGESHPITPDGIPVMLDDAVLEDD